MFPQRDDNLENTPKSMRSMTSMPDLAMMSSRWQTHVKALCLLILIEQIAQTIQHIHGL